MIPVVFDANTVIAGCGWSREPYQCLLMVARRRLESIVTDEIVEEWKNVMGRLEQKGLKFQRDPWPTLNWLVEQSRLVEPAPLGKPRSRDAKDDVYLACALAGQASYVVTRDEDLLVLECPFGVEMLTPRELLSRLARD